MAFVKIALGTSIMAWINAARRPLAILSVAAVLGWQVPAASARTILFVGNSFTYGFAAGGPDLVQPFGASTVTDLNGTGVGGVPALFKSFTQQAGLDYSVSLETVGGTGVDYHYINKLGLINQPWDNVILQSYSTLDATNPGNPAKLIQYSGLLADAFHAQNPAVQVDLDATWSRADQTYRPGGFWYGQSIDAMEKDVQAGYELAAAASPYINGVIPVGAAWNAAIQSGVADANPYDGIDPGKVNLWAPDAYHGSVYGYYLEALTEFAYITGVDPRTLGIDELAARSLGISGTQALALQNVAAQQFATAVPEPSSFAVIAISIFGFGWLRTRRSARPEQHGE